MSTGEMVEVAALQLAAEPGEVEQNRERYVDAVRAVGDGTDLIVTPELAITGYDLQLIDERGTALAEPLDGPSVRVTVELAAKTGATIVLGMLEKHPLGLYDTAVIVTADGTVAPYRKSHLYPPEQRRFRAGNEIRAVDSPAGRIGPLVCFEHAFPSIATKLALDGAQILVIPSAVADGYEYLLTLRSRARAQDNQLFVVACNLAGFGYCGHSLIANPRGDVIAAAGPEETVIRASLDLTAIAREREQEPALLLRQPWLYDEPSEGTHE